jgi:hypothetical protein
MGSLLHCVAGDATGIIISAVVVYHFGLPNGVDLIIEYISAFIVGWLIFQSLFMRAMFGGSYFEAVRKTFFAETVSMNMVMVGMIPTMTILMHWVPGADDPYHLPFWGVMSLATMAGMVTAYPINSWMVAKGLKHGMMSAIPLKSSIAIDVPQKNSPKDEHTMNMSDGMQMQHDHNAITLTKGKSTMILLATFAILILSLFITNIFVPIRLTQF